MELILILFLAGILLLLIEVYLTPGTSIFGFLGVISIIAADYYAYTTLTQPWNWIIPVISLLITGLFLYLLFDMLRSKNFSVLSSIDSKVNVIDANEFIVGQEGHSLTTLRPNGRAEFDHKIIEVVSLDGNYIDDNEPIRIVKRTSDKIFVEPIKK